MFIKLRFLLSVLITVFISGCSDSIDQDALISGLNTYQSSLEPVAQVLINKGDGAMIDLRDMRLRLSSESLKDELNQQHLNALKKANVNFATYDITLGGIIFEIKGSGIAISGSSSGYLYLYHDTADIERVGSIQQAFDKKRARLKDGESLDVRMVQVVNGRWGIYLETF